MDIFNRITLLELITSNLARHW